MTASQILPARRRGAGRALREDRPGAEDGVQSTGCIRGAAGQARHDSEDPMKGAVPP